MKLLRGLDLLNSKTMDRQTIIIILSPGKDPEAWGNLKKACIAKGLSYNSISKKALPFEIQGLTIYRVPFR
jgi:hypothetical protein